MKGVIEKMYYTGLEQPGGFKHGIYDTYLRKDNHYVLFHHTGWYMVYSEDLRELTDVEKQSILCD